MQADFVSTDSAFNLANFYYLRDHMSTDEARDQPKAPSSEELQDALQAASGLQDDLDHYRDVAEGIDGDFRKENEDKRLSLGDLPYGEELIRTRELPENVAEAIALLTSIDDGKLAGADAGEAFQQAESIIEDARSTLNDCTPLPPDDEDDED
jgi:hypothetical protein